MHSDIYLAGAVRTPIGGFSGCFQDVPATDLGSQSIRGTLAATGVDPATIDEVIMGNVLSAGLGQNPARQAAKGAGLADTIGATTINKVCGSGLKAVMLAAQAIRCGDAELLLAGGMENMSRAPYLLEKARSGYRLGHGSLIDSVIQDGLWDVYNDLHMGTCGDRCAETCSFSREQQDDFAVASYQRARQAAASGAFEAELIPVEISHRKGTTTVTEDEEPTRFNEEKLRALRPAFGREGTVTAGNASSLNDGAASILVGTPEQLAAQNIAPQARILGCSSAAREPEWFTLAPIGAMQALLQQLGLTVDDIDLFEINEAFSVVTMAAMQELSIPHAKVNVHGGAVALGHPIGASGTRVLVTLLHAMERHGAQRGIASLCIGGGEAVAIAVERL